jgi:hypothetical protein
MLLAIATQFFDGYAVGMSRLTAVVLAIAACTPAQVPHAKVAAEVMALGGVGGLVAVGIGERETSANLAPLGVGAAVLSAAGILGWALLELQYAPEEPAPETIAQRNRRWAKILTERASGAARENNCARVKRLEARVHVYDAEIHDFVFMRDQEIVRCLSEP